MTDYKNVLYGATFLVVGFLLVFLIGLFNIYKSFVRSFSVIGYVSFNSEKVDTLYTVLGEKKVCKYNSYLDDIGNERYEIVYCDNVLDSNDYMKYSVFLMEDGFVLTQDDIGNSWYVKESVDNDKIIGVYIDESESTIIYQKADGYLYDKEDNKAENSKYV